MTESTIPNIPGDTKEPVAEAPQKDVYKVKNKTRKVLNLALGQIQVDGVGKATAAEVSTLAPTHIEVV